MSLAQSDTDFSHHIAVQGSKRLLSLLRQHHGNGLVEPEPEPAPVEKLEPIPNEVVAQAAEIAFPDWVNAITRIKAAVCKEWDISAVDLISERRTLRHVIPRQVGMYLCRKLTTRSLPEIARRFGGRDHSTVHYAIRKTEERIEADAILRARVTVLAELFGGPVA
jgi:hypothetical protein